MKKQPASPSQAMPRVPRARSQRIRRLSTLSLGVLITSIVLSGCSSAAGQPVDKNKVKLDAALTTARTTYSVPDTLLAPIVKQEQQAASSAGKNAQQPSATYAKLYNQVVSIEQMPSTQARALVQKDLTTLSASLKSVQSDGYVEAAGYATNLSTAKQRFSAATTTKQYFVLDTYVQNQNAAVSSIVPTYTKLTALQAQVKASPLQSSNSSGGSQPLQCAVGTNSTYWWADSYLKIPSAQQTQAAPLLSANWYNSDIQLFRAAATAQDYTTLQSLIVAQSSQLQAQETQMLPSTTQQLLATFKADVAAYQQDGGKDTSFAQQSTQDEQQMTATTLSQYTTLAKTLQQQIDGIQLPLAKVKTQHDLATLKGLISQAQAKSQVDPANGQSYPDAYEYADAHTGIGDAEGRLQNAQTLDDYRVIDQEIEMFITNIQAMLTNLNDSTPVNQVHKTDTQLMQHYGVIGTKTIVVSLREQAARFYDNGKLVKEIDITTGAPDLPSIPGIHCVLDKEQNTTFRSPDPPGSPNYYQPTPIHYALLYSYYGYYLHDAWWRNGFGKYTNLPHWDPAAFNGGSHGCVNMPLDQSKWVFDWANVGMPVIIY